MAHITEEQRYLISAMLEQGYSYTQIGKRIGKHKSSISREIARNKDLRSGKYNSSLAQRKTISRHKTKNKHRPFTDGLKEETIFYLEQDYSPEQIVGLSKKLGKKTVSHETIYKFIWKDKKNKGTLYTHLRHKGKKYQSRASSKGSRGTIPNRIGIEQRPAIVEKKQRFGDLEVDLIIGANHQQALVTINDRASGVFKMKKIESKEASVVSNAIITELEDWIPYIHTMTADNGKEFAEHQKITDTYPIDFYFANPYSPYERGANENLNGLVRQYFPKNYDFTKITDEQVKQVERKINNRPRKRFAFQTPIFMMDKLLFNQDVAFIT